MYTIFELAVGNREEVSKEDQKEIDLADKAMKQMMEGGDWRETLEEEGWLTDLDSDIEGGMTLEDAADKHYNDIVAHYDLQDEVL